MIECQRIVVNMGEVMLREDGIIHIVLKDDFVVELSDRMELVAAIERLCNGTKRPLLIETGDRMDVSNEAKQFDMDKRINKMVFIEALVITSLPTRIAARFYYKLRKVNFKVKTFARKEEALEWLQQEQRKLKKAN